MNLRTIFFILRFSPAQRVMKGTVPLEEINYIPPRSDPFTVDVPSPPTRNMLEPIHVRHIVRNITARGMVVTEN